MTHNNFKTYVIATGIVLAGLLVPQTANSDQSSGFFEQDQAVQDSALSSQSGQGAVTKDATLISNSNVNNNTINVGAGGSFTTGNNIISGQAFSGSNGIDTVIQNSGNNVNIQNQTYVNVSFQ